MISPWRVPEAGLDPPERRNLSLQALLLKTRHMFHKYWVLVKISQVMGLPRTVMKDMLLRKHMLYEQPLQ